MRCGGRFGKGILREGLGQGHLTEGPRPDRTRLRALPLDETRGQKPTADERHHEQQPPPRSTPLKDSFRARGRRGLHAPARRDHDGLGRRRVTLRARRSRLDRRPVVRAGALRRARGALRARRDSRRANGRATRAHLPHGRGSCRRPACHRRPRRMRRRTPARVLGNDPGRIGAHRRRSGLRRRRLRLRLRDRWAFRHLARGKQRQRVEVPVGVGREPDPEVDVGLDAFDVSARPDRPDDVALGDQGSVRDRDRPQVDERDGVAVGGPHGEAEPLMRQLPHKRHDPVRRGAHVRPRRGADVDAAVLASRVRIASVDERPQHRSVDGPSPRRGARSQHEEREQHADDVACFENHAARVQSRSAVVKSGYSESR
jgi:hypothetical protein